MKANAGSLWNVCLPSPSGAFQQTIKYEPSETRSTALHEELCCYLQLHVVRSWLSYLIIFGDGVFAGVKVI